ncbi:hypothetical protein KFL_001930160 [Klebsormidium nitens]|uniref:Casein kinase substrate phosphoprotein PP28 domain-containing protein n=1 Tax=Klebsormidium nitens TaxID=105231 RepID=A0A1Y1I8W7_KLENI|nr:hypothetical protein KFL_001930160 [Klebsormidium nitens]|eukprot:GAQ84538.1 hypothetical protein KFL_001930160 [Klebsormidium nitens]
MGSGAGRGKFKKGPTGRKNFSTPEEIAAGADGPRSGFRKKDPEEVEDAEEEEEESSEEESSEEEDDDQKEKKGKGVQNLIATDNPNAAKKTTVKAKDIDLATSKGPELSRREREELEKQRAKERYWKLHEQGKTEEARKDLERLAIIRQQREEAAKKREEEKAAREAKAAATKR